jgi:Uma2 family endonuclease
LVSGADAEIDMADATKPERWTYAKYRTLPDDRNRYEIIRGELIVSPAPKSKHQTVVWNLTMLLGKFLGDHGLGVGRSAPMDVVLADDSVVQPDLLVVRKERLEIIGEDGLTAAPDLVVEVLSESSRKRDHAAKRHLYAEYGVREYWLVDPDVERIEIHVLEGADLVLKSIVSEGAFESPVVLPGFRADIASLFA